MLQNEIDKYSINLQKERNIKRNNIKLVTLGIVSTIWVLSTRKFNKSIESLSTFK